MDPVPALIVLAAVVLLATAVGLVTSRRDGRVRGVAGSPAVTPAALGVDTDAGLGERATLVQFSTEHCARCPATRRLLGAVAAERPGVRHLEVDLTHRPDIARRFRVLQTPTTLIVDPRGTVRARIAGAPLRADVARELDRLQEDVHA
jgi:thiol-disulfide isomerase/thioredoxin